MLLELWGLKETFPYEYDVRFVSAKIERFCAQTKILEQKIVLC